MSLGTLEGLSPGILIPQSPSPFLTTGTQDADVRYGGSAPTRRCEATGRDWAKRATSAKRVMAN